MSDLWDGLGANINAGSGDGQWLYRTGADMHGPVPQRAIAEKWLAGELTAATPVARQGTEFAPLGQVAAFARFRQPAEDAAAQRLRRAAQRKTLAGALLLAIGLVGAGVLLKQAYGQNEAQERQEQARLDKVAADAALAQAQVQAEAERQAHMAHASAHAMKLVALVSLGTLQDIKITKPTPSPKSAAATRRRNARHALAAQGAGASDAGGPTATDPGPIDDSTVESCQLTQQDIFGTLRQELAKLNVCVEDEKRRDTENLLPKSLELQFVVKSDGRVTEFVVNDRHFRSGPLNNCLVKAFKTIHFPTTQGANCPVTLPIRIGV